jgi:hypothetical protein
VSLDDLALPEALEQLLRAVFPDEVMSRRAVLAPWAETDFRSAFDDSGLWSGDGGTRATERRALYERLFREQQERFTAGHPYFVSPGTDGALASPYPELSDAEYWLFVVYWGSEPTARRALEHWPSVTLDGRTTLDFLRRKRGARLLPRLRRLLDRQSTMDVMRLAWDAQGEIAHPVYM